MKKIFLILILSGLFLAFSSNKAYADAGILINVKDTISTSRPSASTPLAADLAVGQAAVSIVDNGSRFIASDSAKLLGDTLETITIASMSAASGGNRTLYFATNNTGTHHKGSAVIAPVTAKHTISFTTSNAVPSNGRLQVIFPAGDTTNAASPSASGFSFNGLESSNISINGASCGSWTITPASGLVQCNLSVGVSANAEVTITIGNSTPQLINPTKVTTAGTADLWILTVRTQDSAANIIDSSKIKIGTVDSVEVYATVDPVFTFSIAGINNGLAVNTGNATGCTNTETINTGFNSSATEVNLGALGRDIINRSAQLITITTNGSGGYVLTATSSGHLIDPATGYWLADAQGTPTNYNTPAPAFLTAGTTAFGIHPCGLDVTTGTWGSGATGGGAGAKYANPSPVYYYKLAEDTDGPVTTDVTAGNGLITVQYAATISAVVPSGLYRTALTYVATPTF
ncbi:hypothetical protein C4578_02535 [Candidatus Microgenomates bacterium]|jgi:hypothetical protein|nr:MAG: hypothetical protein C4578_02535 [Candidatus Microgenomates bacterium]